MTFNSVSKIAPRQVTGWSLIALLIFYPLASGNLYYVSVAQAMAVNAALAIAVVVLLGYAGEFSFAYAAIFGAAGYISWELEHVVSQQVALLGGVVGGVMAGVVIAAPAARVRGLQLGLLTLAAGLAASQVFARISGFDGIVPLPPLQLGISVLTPNDSLVVVGIVLAICYAIASIIVLGRHGRRLLLMQTDLDTARTLGIRVTRERVFAFGASALVLSLIGCVYPQILSQLSPAPYDFSVVVTALLIAVIGGLLWVEGAIAGAIIYGVITEAVNGAPTGSQAIISGVILLLVLILAPAGILGAGGQLVREATRRIRPRGNAGRSRMRTEASASPPRLIQPGSRRSAFNTDPGAMAGEREPAATALAVRGVGKRFGGLQALDNVGFQVEPGELVGLVGANGAGKSTLLNVVSGLIAPDVGDVWLNGQTAGGLRPEERARRGLGRAFQTPRLVGGLTVADNIRCGSEVSKRGGHDGRATRKPVEEVLERLDLRNVASVPAQELPYGLAKLVDIARALVREPTALLVDEPAAGLGQSELPRLGATLDALREDGIALVVVEHNVEFLASLADRLVVLDFGRVIASGTPRDVLRDRLVVDAYIGQAVEQ